MSDRSVSANVKTCDPVRPGLPLGARPPSSPASEQAETAPPVADASPSRPKPTYENDVAPTIDRYRVDSHDFSTNRGGIALDGFDEEAPSLETWSRVADALRNGTMPPTGRARPSPSELAALDDWLDAEVFQPLLSPTPSLALIRCSGSIAR